MSPRLTLTDHLPQQLLQLAHIVVLETPHSRSTQPRSEPNARVVQLVRDDQASFSNDSGECSGVGSESHRDDHGVVLAEETSDERFSLDMQVERSSLQTRSSCADSVPTDGFLNGIGASSRSGGETEVVVRRDVEASSPLSRVLEGEVGVVGGSVEGDDGTSWDAGDGFAEAVVETGFETTGVEGVEVRVESSVALQKRGRQEGEREEKRGQPRRFRFESRSSVLLSSISSSSFPPSSHIWKMILIYSCLPLSTLPQS